MDEITRIAVAVQLANGKLHQVMLTKDQNDAIIALIETTSSNNTIRLFEEAIESIEFDKK